MSVSGSTNGKSRSFLVEETLRKDLMGLVSVRIEGGIQMSFGPQRSIITVNYFVNILTNNLQTKEEREIEDISTFPFLALLSETPTVEMKSGVYKSKRLSCLGSVFERFIDCRVSENSYYYRR